MWTFWNCYKDIFFSLSDTVITYCSPEHAYIY